MPLPHITVSELRMASVPRFPSVTNVDHVGVCVKAVQTFGYDYPPPLKRRSTGGNSSAELLPPVLGRLPPVLGCVFRSYYLAIYLPSKLLVGVFPCRRARSNGIYDISHVTVMLHYEISIRMLTQHNQES